MSVRIAAVLAAVLLVSCGGEADPWSSPVAFDTARARILTGSDTVPLLVELARTDEQRRFGLQARPRLDPGSGMLFLYDSDQPGERYFWMFNTKIPLDIAFVDSTGVIDTILAMTPCEAELYPRQACRRYSPGTPFRRALEVNRGWFGDHGVVPGDRIVVDTAAPGSHSVGGGSP